MASTLSVLVSLGTSVIGQTLRSIYAALPNILTGLIFLVFAYIGIRLATDFSRRALYHTYSEKMIADLIVTVEKVFLWFGTFLVFFNILGMGEIAASLGTATGFIALGIALALKDMLADVVAGVYLLKDQDFNPGDTVKTSDAQGEITSIDLRKTRLELESGNTMVLANKEVEKKWEKFDE